MSRRAASTSAPRPKSSGCSTAWSHNGAAILMISSEQIEIVHVCDRAYVMRSGRIAGELAHHELTEANIVRLGMHQ